MLLLLKCFVLHLGHTCLYIVHERFNLSNHEHLPSAQQAVYEQNILSVTASVVIQQQSWTKAPTFLLITNQDNTYHHLFLLSWFLPFHPHE